ncbi:hypothetical protein QJQ45_013911, partial [Haematococcus lacustris]
SVAVRLYSTTQSGSANTSMMWQAVQQAFSFFPFNTTQLTSGTAALNASNSTLAPLTPPGPSTLTPASSLLPDRATHPHLTDFPSPSQFAAEAGGVYLPPQPQPSGSGWLSGFGGRQGGSQAGGPGVLPATVSALHRLGWRTRHANNAANKPRSSVDSATVLRRSTRDKLAEVASSLHRLQASQQPAPSWLAAHSLRGSYPNLSQAGQSHLAGEPGEGWGRGAVLTRRVSDGGWSQSQALASAALRGGPPRRAEGLHPALSRSGGLDGSGRGASSSAWGAGDPVAAGLLFGALPVRGWARAGGRTEPSDKDGTQDPSTPTTQPLPNPFAHPPPTTLLHLLSVAGSDTSAATPAATAGVDGFAPTALRIPSPRSPRLGLSLLSGAHRVTSAPAVSALSPGFLPTTLAPPSSPAPAPPLAPRTSSNPNLLQQLADLQEQHLADIATPNRMSINLSRGQLGGPQEVSLTTPPGFSPMHFAQDPDNVPVGSLTAMAGGQGLSRRMSGVFGSPRRMNSVPGTPLPYPVIASPPLHSWVISRVASGCATVTGGPPTAAPAFVQISALSGLDFHGQLLQPPLEQPSLPEWHRDLPLHPGLDLDTLKRPAKLRWGLEVEIRGPGQQLLDLFQEQARLAALPEQKAAATAAATVNAAKTPLPGACRAAAQAIHAAKLQEARQGGRRAMTPMFSSFAATAMQLGRPGDWGSIGMASGVVSSAAAARAGVTAVNASGDAALAQSRFVAHRSASGGFAGLVPVMNPGAGVLPRRSGSPLRTEGGEASGGRPSATYLVLPASATASGKGTSGSGGNGGSRAVASPFAAASQAGKAAGPGEFAQPEPPTAAPAFLSGFLTSQGGKAGEAGGGPTQRAVGGTPLLNDFIAVGGGDAVKGGGQGAVPRATAAALAAVAAVVVPSAAEAAAAEAEAQA